MKVKGVLLNILMITGYDVSQGCNYTSVYRLNGVDVSEYGSAGRAKELVRMEVRMEMRRGTSWWDWYGKQKKKKEVLRKSVQYWSHCKYGLGRFKGSMKN